MIPFTHTLTLANKHPFWSLALGGRTHLEMDMASVVFVFSAPNCVIFSSIISFPPFATLTVVATYLASYLAVPFGLAFCVSITCHKYPPQTCILLSLFLRGYSFQVIPPSVDHGSFSAEYERCCSVNILTGVFLY